jgi:hypothetical protein
LKIGQPFLTVIMYIRMYIHVYIPNTKESLVLGLEIGTTN